MDQHRGARLRWYFEQALEASPVEEVALIAQAEAEEPGMGSEVEDLLDAFHRAGDRFDTLNTPAAALLLEQTAGDDFPASGRLGRFEVRERLGSGGMATAWKAYDPKLEREVALKVLKVAGLLPDGGADSLLREARAASSLDHPSIATVYDVGKAEDGRVFIAMAYYSGRTLADRLTEGPLPRAEALRVASEVADALEAAHAAGIVHGDIKPANIMLLPEGSVRVLDFGIARTLHGDGDTDRAIAGTPAYMSPEQARGDGMDTRTDLWSLGVMLYEMITGEKPYSPGSGRDLLERIQLQGAPDALDLPRLPARVRPLVQRCLQELPENRFPTAGELRNALRGAARPGRGRVRVAGIAGLVVVGTAAAVLWSTISGGPPAGAAIAVLPPATAPDDPELGRLGRELAVTLALTLDGMGDIRTLNPLSLLSERSVLEAAPSETGGLEAGRRLGASRVVVGTLIRTGASDVRADLQLLDSESGSLLAQASATVPLSGVLALTDSLSWGLLREIWTGDDTPPSPSLSGATTRSIPALRAFLGGERAIIEGRFREAPEHFARAVELDSTFVLANWRLWWTLAWWGEPVPGEVEERVLNGLARLPRRDSALVVAGAIRSIDDRYAALRGVAESYPTDWLAWFAYQDFLVHTGGAAGHELAESREALERLVTLRPDLVKAWDHLLMVVREQRDVDRLETVVQRLEALRYDSLSVRQGGFDDLLYFQVQTRILVNQGRLTEEDLQVTHSALGAEMGPSSRLRLVSNLVSEGLAEAQLQASDTLTSDPSSTSVEAAAWFARALALARLGRWREALSAAEAYDERSALEQGTTFGLRLAAVGSALGFLDTSAASPWVERGEELLGQAASPELRAEISWLLGLAAFAARDAERLAGHRASLAEAPDGRSGDLARSLAAAERALAGDESGAGAELSALVRERIEAGRAWSPFPHPFLDGTVRLLAARWLRGDDPGTARSLLTWHEMILPDLEPWMVIRANRVLEPMAWALRAELERELGRQAPAAWFAERVEEAWSDADPGPSALLAGLEEIAGG